MLQGQRFLSAEQLLLTTLIVKLAVVAVLATMLARYHRFRHILIFERRGWIDRLVFTMSLGLPLMAGVASRILLNYDAADLTLEGAFLAGLIAGPYAGALGTTYVRAEHVLVVVLLRDGSERETHKLRPVGGASHDDDY